MKEKKRIPVIAAALSLVTPGLGQLYNGQIFKGLIFFLAFLLIPAALFLARLPSQFQGMVAILVIILGIWIFAIAEAFSAAKRRPGFVLKGYNRWYVYLLIIVLVFGIPNILAGPVTKLATDVLGFKARQIPTGSMEPALLTGDLIITDLKYFKKNELRRRDLVIIQDPKNPSMDYVKRVIALEGEKIEIRKKQVYINDEVLSEPDVIRNDPNQDVAQRDDFGPLLVPPGMCFVLGDNRDNSVDSRIWGPLPLGGVKGKPLYVYWAKDKSRIGKKLR
jgi:signal peptidase I